MTRSRHRIRAALKEPANVGAVITLAHAVLVGMTGNTWFPDPVPPLSTIASALAALEEATAVAQGGALGAVEKRDAARDLLVIHLQMLRAYVQWIAALNPEHAASIIQRSGFSVAAKVVPEKPPFAVLAGDLSGSVVLVVRAVKKVATYEYAYSPDGGQTWIVVGQTNETRKEVSGLQPGKTYSFRFRVLTRTGQGDWSDSIPFMVR